MTGYRSVACLVLALILINSAKGLAESECLSCLCQASTGCDATRPCSGFVNKLSSCNASIISNGNMRTARSPQQQGGSYPQGGGGYPSGNSGGPGNSYPSGNPGSSYPSNRPGGGSPSNYPQSSGPRSTSVSFPSANVNSNIYTGGKRGYSSGSGLSGGGVGGSSVGGGYYGGSGFYGGGYYGNSGYYGGGLYGGGLYGNRGYQSGYSQFNRNGYQSGAYLGGERRQGGGFGSGGFSSNGGLVSRGSGGLSDACLSCICNALTGCNAHAGCSNGGCGAFRISRSYWSDAGQPGGSYDGCVNDYSCSLTCARSYLARHARNCDGIDCVNYARIHVLGPYGCQGYLDPSLESRIQSCAGL